MKKFLWFLIATYSIPAHLQAQAQLVPVKKIIPTIICDIRYATKNNFTGQQVYNLSECYLLAPVAQALNKVQKELSLQGLGLKIWDGYRPLTAQWKLWHIVPDKRYVSNPKNGGKHCRGTAVDVTLVNLKTGKELPMPTGFDEFTERAWANYDNLPDDVKKNRKSLRDVMYKHGFSGITSEWWHFDYKGWRDLPSLDIPLCQLGT